MRPRTYQFGASAGAILAAAILSTVSATASVDTSTTLVNVPQGSDASNQDVIAAWGGNPILPGNLATTATVTLEAGSPAFDSAVANINDSLMVSSVSPAGGPYVLDNTGNAAAFAQAGDGGPAQLKVVLDGPRDLAVIDVFTSYQWTRVGQKWAVYTSTDAGATWSATPLASVNFPDAGSLDFEVYQSRRVRVQGTTPGTAVATGVNALRFDIYDTEGDPNGVSVFSEIAIYAVPGTVTVSSASVALPQGGASSDASIVNAWGGNPILPGNLAANAAVTLTAGSAPFGGTVANLKDGLMVSSVSPAGGPYVVDTTANSMNFDNASSFTMVFDASYNLARIDAFTSYQWSRTGQKWEVFTSSDGGATWSDTPLASVDYPNVNTGGYDSRRVTVSDSGGTAAIASNVNALRFDVYDTDTGGGGDAVAIFSEIAVYAVPGQLTVSSSLVGIPQGGGSSNADIVNAWGGNPILSGNLATNATITLLSGGYPFGGSVANLKDGLMLSSVDPVGGPYQLENTANSAAFDNGSNPSQVELVLDGTYNLTRIDVFTSYAWNRTGQKWEVFTSTDGGATWSETALASVDYGNQTVATWQSRRTTLVDSGGTAIIAPGVNALRFDIYDTDTGGGGDAEAVFSEIAVYGAAPGPVPPSGLSYAPSSQTGTVGTSITSMIPTVTGTVTGYSVSPALPSGLLLDAVTGTISGTPSAAAATATYTVTAANAGGSTTATVSIGVQSAYAAWAQGAPLDSTNLLLYAIGGASGPAATNGVAPVTVVNSNLLSIVAVVRTNDPSLTVRGQSILNLSSGTWITNDVTMNPSVDQAGVPSGTQRQIFSTPRATNDTRKFLRLQTTLAP